MSLSMPVVWSEAHRQHSPGAEIWVGVRTPGIELPERADRIRAALEDAGARVVAAEPHPEEALLAAHDEALLGYLAGAWESWVDDGLDRDPGQDRVVPYIVPHPGWLGELEPAAPAAASARAGLFAYDTMTLIGPGTWDAVRGAADLVAAGEPAAYALCRPPGHHATRRCFGGSCYLNSSAIAAAALRERLGGRVAVLDVDAHHGNGTQQIFYEDAAVLTGSVHVDRAGFRTSWASPPSVAPAAGRTPTATYPWPPARATGPGSRPWPLSAAGRATRGPAPSSSRSASTRPAAIPRARWR